MDDIITLDSYIDMLKVFIDVTQASFPQVSEFVNRTQYLAGMSSLDITYSCNKKLYLIDTDDDTNVNTIDY